MKKTLFLSEELKGRLKKTWGLPIFGKKERVEREFKKFLEKKKAKKIITVGDFCSQSLISDVKIFDGKIRRKKIKNRLKAHLKCENPKGTIQAEIWPKIKKAIRENKNLFIEGEEDLLVIPAVLLAPKNSLVVYGFPKKGICVIEVNAKTKKEIKRLLSQFKQELIC